MNPNDAINLLEHIASLAPVPLAVHVQARQAAEVLRQHLAPALAAGPETA